MSDDRFNVYLPATLARRVREAREAGTPLNVSAAAQEGIAAALNGQQLTAGTGCHQCGRLDAIKHKLSQLAYVLVLLLVGVGVLAVSVRALATS